MEKPAISLTPAEWLVMEPLWERPRTLAQLMNALAPRVDWSRSTVKTMVSRLEDKGHILHTSNGRAKLFYPAFTREQAAVSETNMLLDRAYQGSLGRLVRTMLRRKGVNREELRQLYRILDEVGGNRS